MLSKIFAIVYFFLAVLHVTCNHGWKPSKCLYCDFQILTEWGDRVINESKKGDILPWPEYPRPQLIRSSPWLIINGLWNYSLTSDLDDKPLKWSAQLILVPYPIESSLSGVSHLLTPTEAFWYRRIIPIEGALRPRTDERLLLHFEGVDYEGKVWVNEKLVGHHKGMSTSWSCDITDSINNRIIADILIKVTDPTGKGTQPRGKQSLSPRGCFYTRMSGIWQTVWIERVPGKRITSIFPESLDSLDGVNVTVFATDLNATITIRLYDGKKLVSIARGVTGKQITMSVPNPKLWSNVSPFLYNMKVTLHGGETISSYTAIRRLDMRIGSGGYNRLFLNGEEIFLLGPLDQGWWPESLLTPPSDEAMKFDLTYMKKAGYNAVRKHMKLENSRYYRACDEIGLLVWQDLPGSRDSNINVAARQTFYGEAQSIIEKNRFFPCIVVWVLFNEGWGQFDRFNTLALIHWTRELDNTRLIDAASGWHDYGGGDFADAHRYPGPASPALDPRRVAVAGEFGGQGLVIPGHVFRNKSWGYKSSPNLEAYSLKYYELIEDLKPLKRRGLSAAIYTQTTDVEIETNGLLTFDRKVSKIPILFLAEVNTAAIRPMPPVRVILPTSELSPVDWRVTTSLPGPNWTNPKFNDSAWILSPGGFGKITKRENSGMAYVRTAWENGHLWLRRSFDYDGAAVTKPAIVIYCDDNSKIWLNGKVLGRFGLKNDGAYNTIQLKSLPLVKGVNTVAISAHRRAGLRKDGSDAYIDFGFVDLA